MNNSESHHHDDANEASPIEALSAEYRRRAAVLDGWQLPISSADDAWLAEPLNGLVAAPATTARDFAAKIVAHANLLGLHDDGECMSIVEASVIRDAHPLLGVSAA